MSVLFAYPALLCAAIVLDGLAAESASQFLGDAPMFEGDRLCALVLVAVFDGCYGCCVVATLRAQVFAELNLGSAIPAAFLRQEDLGLSNMIHVRQLNS